MRYDVLKIKITEKCNRNCSFCVFHNGIRAEINFDKKTVRLLEKPFN